MKQKEDSFRTIQGEAEVVSEKVKRSLCVVIPSRRGTPPALDVQNQFLLNTASKPQRATFHWHEEWAGARPGSLSMVVH